MLNNEKDNLEICLIRDGHRAVLEAEERIYQQQAEIARLQSILLCFMDEVNKWENKHGLDISELPLIPIRNEAEKIKNQIESKAIKEFWDKLKKHSRKMQSSDFSGEFWDRAVLVEDGDNLVKERSEVRK